jgi:hypothetical protein
MLPKRQQINVLRASETLHNCGPADYIADAAGSPQ